MNRLFRLFIHDLWGILNDMGIAFGGFIVAGNHGIITENNFGCITGFKPEVTVIFDDQSRSLQGVESIVLDQNRFSGGTEDTSACVMPEVASADDEFRRPGHVFHHILAENDFLRNLGDPKQDIGRVAVFLASEDASYVTGETITLQGGSGLRP